MLAQLNRLLARFNRCLSVRTEHDTRRKLVRMSLLPTDDVDYYDHARVRCEIAVGLDRWCNFGFAVAEDSVEGELMVHLCAPFVDAFVTVDPASDSRLHRHLACLRHPVETAIRLYAIDNELVYIQRMRTNGDDFPRINTWRNAYVNVTSAVLGKHKCDRMLVADQDVTLHMPERSYWWRAKVWHQEHYREWLPWMRTVRTCVDLESYDGQQVPIPGKGENAWDCGDDALYGYYVKASSVDDAVTKVSLRIAETRARYGGADWHPAVPQ